MKSINSSSVHCLIDSSKNGEIEVLSFLCVIDNLQVGKHFFAETEVSELANKSCNWSTAKIK